MNLIKPTAVLAVLSLVSLGFAQAPKNYAISPVPHPGYEKRHESFNEISKQGEAQLVFLGDSITQGWDRAGKAVWEKYWAPLKAANFGINGDRTEHVLWRLAHGNFDGLRPKLVVLLIGTNNTGHEGRPQQELDGAVYHCNPEQTADGVKAIVDQLKKKLPGTKILVLGILPRGSDNKDKQRQQNDTANEMIAKLADGATVHYLDIGPAFLAQARNCGLSCQTICTRTKSVTKYSRTRSR